MFEKVLLATDLSPTYEKLTECIMELKEIGTEEIILVWAVNVRSSGYLVGVQQERHQERLKKKGRELEKKAEELGEQGLKVSYEAPVGMPSREIERLAREKEVDLIVIGSRGKRKISDMFLGSTTSNVIRLSEVPVLVERIEFVEELDKTTCKLVCTQKLRSLLLATDFSKNARKAEEAALELSSAADKVVIVSVAEAESIEEEDSPAVPEKREELEELKEKFSEKCNEVKIKLEKGIASENINRIASEEDSTLIIMGKKGRGGLKELLLGSTAENVSRRSKKPVLLIPEGGVD